MVRIAASHLGSEVYERGHLFMGPVVGPAQMSRDAARNLYRQAGFGPEGIQLVQVHDAFVIEELEYYELLGFCREGEAEKCIEEGRFAPGGAVPFSTAGGLTARGHPGGPTGLAQVWETTLQLRGEAGKRQVPNARAGLCHDGRRQRAPRTSWMRVARGRGQRTVLGLDRRRTARSRSPRPAAARSSRPSAPSRRCGRCCTWIPRSRETTGFRLA
jgi:hypothetical protein